MMDLATFLRSSANFVVGAGVVKLLVADLRAEIHHDGASLRAKADSLVRRAPYRAAGIAAMVGALTGIMLAHQRPSRNIPTRH